jgi:hypothetical protein
MSDAQSSWENQRDIDCAEHNQPKCPKFPDDSCDECHNQHVKEHEFNQWCETCADEKCPQCEGLAYLYLKISGEYEETECLRCEATGRIK